MKRFIAIAAVMVAMMVFTTQESNAQFYRGGSGISIGFSSFGGGFNRGGFNSGFGGYGGGFNRGFNNAGFGRSVGYSSFRPSYSRSYYGGGFNRGFSGGGFSGGGRGCGY